MIAYLNSFCVTLANSRTGIHLQLEFLFFLFFFFNEKEVHSYNNVQSSTIE